MVQIREDQTSINMVCAVPKDNVELGTAVYVFYTPLLSTHVHSCVYTWVHVTACVCLESINCTCKWWRPHRERHIETTTILRSTTQNARNVVTMTKHHIHVHCWVAWEHTLHACNYVRMYVCICMHTLQNMKLANEATIHGMYLWYNPHAMVVKIHIPCFLEQRPGPLFPL